MLKSVLLTLALCVVSLGGRVPSAQEEPEEYIVGGKEIDISEAPYQAVVINNGRVVGGAVILSPTILLTAATLIFREIANTTTYRVGSSQFGSGGVVEHAKKFYIPKQFSFTERDYNIAIVELAKPLSFNKNIQAIKIAPSEPADNAQAKLTGFGQLSDNENKFNSLRAVSIPIVSRKTCAPIYSGRHEITSRMLCAGSNGKNFRWGDIGSPLVVDNHLVGIASFGKNFEKSETPGVFMSVANKEVRAFITKHAKV